MMACVGSATMDCVPAHANPWVRDLKAVTSFLDRYKETATTEAHEVCSKDQCEALTTNLASIELTVEDCSDALELLSTTAWPTVENEALSSAIALALKRCLQKRRSNPASQRMGGAGNRTQKMAKCFMFATESLLNMLRSFGGLSQIKVDVFAQYLVHLNARWLDPNSKAGCVAFILLVILGYQKAFELDATAKYNLLRELGERIKYWNKKIPQTEPTLWEYTSTEQLQASCPKTYERMFSAEKPFGSAVVFVEEYAWESLLASIPRRSNHKGVRSSAGGLAAGRQPALQPALHFAASLHDRCIQDIPLSPSPSPKKRQLPKLTYTIPEPPPQTPIEAPTTPFTPTQPTRAVASPATPVTPQVPQTQDRPALEKAKLKTPELDSELHTNYCQQLAATPQSTESAASKLLGMLPQLKKNTEQPGCTSMSIDDVSAEVSRAVAARNVVREQAKEAEKTNQRQGWKEALEED